MEPKEKEHTYRSRRSDEVQEILSRPPSWIIRWGTTIVFLFVFILVAITFIIPSSTTIQGQAGLALERAHAGEDKGFVAVVQLRQENFDQVGKGQKARIKLRAYNSADFGVLEGTVVAVAEEFSSHDGSFEVRISVPVKRKTTRGYEVRYVPGMLGDVEIIVRKERLIQKLIRF